MEVGFKSVILREPQDFHTWLRFVHSVRFVHTMAIHPKTQVGSKLFLCSTGRGICHLQAKLSKLQRQRGTTIHKLKPQAVCYWTEPQWRLSHLQTRKYTPFHSSPHKQPLRKTGFPAFTLKIAMNLYKHGGSSFKKKHILLRNTNGWTLQNQANSPPAHATFAVGAELHCLPAEAQHEGFLLPWLVGKPEQSEFPCYMPPVKSNASWGVQLQAEKHAVREEVTTAIRKKWFPTTGPMEERMVRYRLPTAMKKLHRMMWVPLQAKSFKAIKKLSQQ